MAKEKELKDLFHDTLKDIYFAEKKILTPCRRWRRPLSHRRLKAAFEKHEAETESRSSGLTGVHVDRRNRRARPAMPSWASSTRARRSWTSTRACRLLTPGCSPPLKRSSTTRFPLRHAENLGIELGSRKP